MTKKKLHKTYPLRECKNKKCKSVFESRTWNHSYCKQECQGYIKKERSKFKKSVKRICDNCLMHCRVDATKLDKKDMFFCTDVCKDRYTIKQLNKKQYGKS